MKRSVGRMASVLVGMACLAGCASSTPADNGPLTPIGDMSQVGTDNGRGPDHDFSGVPPGIGGGAENGPAVPGGINRGGSTSLGGGF